jgi:alkylhydroperoxidase family enzyme
VRAVRRVEEAVLRTPGALDPATREAIAAGDRPDELAPYLDKVTRHAYKVTDDDVARVRAAGYVEDAIFEATLAAALGAARLRLQKGLDALEEL